MKTIHYISNSIIALFIIISCVLWGTSIWLFQNSYYNNTKITCKPHSLVSPEQIKIKGDENEPLYIALTKYIEKQKIISDEFINNIDVIEYWGDVQLLIDENVVYENYYPENIDRCIMSSAAAYKIWGSQNVTAKTIIYNNKEYSVNFIHDDDTEIIYIENSNEAELYDNIELYYYGENSITKAENFLLSKNISADIINRHIHNFILSLSVRLPIYSVITAAAVILIKKLCLLRIPYSLICIVFALFIISLILKIPDIKLLVPDELIPTQWSDFSFWKNQAMYYKNAVLQYVSTQMTPNESVNYINQLLCITFSLLSSISHSILAVIIYIDLYSNKKRPLTMPAVQICISFTVFYIFSRSQMQFEINSAYLLLMPIYTLFCSITNILSVKKLYVKNNGADSIL